MSGYGYGVCPCHECNCTLSVCERCGTGMEDLPQSIYDCQECGAPAGVDCDDVCPSGIAELEALEVAYRDIPEDFLTPAQAADLAGAA